MGFKPENMTHCSDHVSWNACFQHSLGDRSPCLGTPSRQQETRNNAILSPPLESEPGDEG
jgi:hypothetical protein